MRRWIWIIVTVLITANLKAQTITYYNTIQAIIQTKCTPCHRHDEAAPFVLLSYEDVAKRASFIKDVVETNYMPPWKADNKYVHFVNDRSLTPKERDLLIQWIKDKAPEGTPVANKKVKQDTLTGTMYKRKPDLTLKIKDSFIVKGDNLERFIVFKIPFELQQAENVEAIEFYSNNRKLIHHANYEVHEIADTSIDIYKTDAFINLTEDNRQKYDQYLPYRKTITYYGGWIPGSTFETYPKNFGWVMPKRGVILMTIHFAPTSKNAGSIDGINLFFKKTPVVRSVKVISFGSGGIGEDEITPMFYIPANQQKTFKLDVTNPKEDFSVLYVWPHMHYLGKEFKAYAIKPGGDTIKLVHIPDWDFRWQEIYRFNKLVRIPKGSVIHIEGTYDNTAQNPFNPSDPPQPVMSYGDMRSTDEMMTLMMVFLPYKPGDENLVLQY
jgi:hypothetical protein